MGYGKEDDSHWNLILGGGLLLLIVTGTIKFFGLVDPVLDLLADFVQVLIFLVILAFIAVIYPKLPNWMTSL